MDGSGTYVSRYVDVGTIEYTHGGTSPATRVTAAPLVPLETLIAETEPQVMPAP